MDRRDLLEDPQIDRSALSPRATWAGAQPGTGPDFEDQAPRGLWKITTAALVLAGALVCGFWLAVKGV